MKIPSFWSLSLGLAIFSSASAAATKSTLGRKAITNLVTQILASMVAHDPSTLPMADLYSATENSHPAALSFMTSWRTITKVTAPNLLAIDVHNQTAYFALDISEGNDATPNVLRGRIALNNTKISEMELFINRNRGDHGFSFGASELAANYAPLMDPPSNRTKATRKELMSLSRGLFGTYISYFNVSDTCEFTEVGWTVIDRGNYNNGSLTDSVACGWKADQVTDANARVGLVIDEDLGFVVTSGVVQGTVFGYGGNLSAFIPNGFTEAQAIQRAYLESAVGQGVPLLNPFGASGDTLEVLQYYDSAIQATQINVYLSGPNMTSPWLTSQPI